MKNNIQYFINDFNAGAVIIEDNSAIFLYYNNEAKRWKIYIGDSNTLIEEEVKSTKQLVKLKTIEIPNEFLINRCTFVEVEWYTNFKDTIDLLLADLNINLIKTL